MDDCSWPQQGHHWQLRIQWLENRHHVLAIHFRHQWNLLRRCWKRHHYPSFIGAWNWDDDLIPSLNSSNYYWVATWMYCYALKLKSSYHSAPFSSCAFLASSSCANRSLSFSANFSSISFSKVTLYSIVTSLLLTLIRWGKRYAASFFRFSPS